MASFWQVTAPYRDTAAGQVLGSLDSAFALQGTFITASPLSCVIRVMIDGQHFYVKTYTRGGKNLKRWLGRSRARAEWENLLYFQQLGIPTAPLVAYGQEMRLGLFRRGALVTREVAGTCDLARLGARHDPRLAQRDWVQHVSRRIADYTRRMHRDGFSHLDLKLRNILVSLGETPQVYFIDCPAGRHRRGPMAERWFIKDLACLDRDARESFTRTRRLRFFLDYRDRRVLDRPEKQMIARVLHFFHRRPHRKTAAATSRREKPQLPIYNAKTLRRAGHNLSTPFAINYERGGIVSSLRCRDILRHLPGRRLVCRVDRGQAQTAITKIFLDRRRSQRHLKRELRGLRALQTPSLASPQVLDHGRVEGGGALLLLDEIENVQRLDHFWSQLADDPSRQRTLERVVVCIAQLHAMGLKQRDIHLGNFLISEKKIGIIDGSALLGRPWRNPLTRRQSLSNLALFWAQFDPGYDHWMPQALARYCGIRQWSRHPALHPKMIAAVQRHRIKRLRNHSRKMMRTSTAAVARRQWHHHILCDRRWYTPDREGLLKNPDEFMGRGTILKDGNSATVARVRFQGQDLVIKRYNQKNGLHFMRRCLRHSRAVISWRNARALKQLGINTPQPLAMVEERWGPFRFRAYYISVFQPGPTLASYWQEDWAANDTRDAPVGALLRLFKKMAAVHICHGDLKASNMVVDGDDIALVDLDGLRICRSERVFLKGFRKDCRRFEKNWTDHPNIRRRVTESLTRLRQSIGDRSNR